jgi:hypothetical protein
MAFVRLRKLENRGSWHLYIDELPSIINFDRIKAVDSHGLLTDHLSTEHFGPNLAMLVVDDEDGLIDLIDRSKRNDILEKPAKVAAMALSGAFYMYVQEADHQALIDGKSEKSYLQCMSIFDPEMLSEFASVTICAALFEETIEFRMWEKLGVRFQIAEHLPTRYTEHPNGHLVDILYLSDRLYSKNRRNADGIEELIHKSTLSVFGDEPFLWHANKDIGDELFDLSRAVRLPHKCEGSNKYADKHNVVFISAYNPPPYQVPFYVDFGFTREDLYRCLYQHAVYQAVCRCSIRILANQDRKKIIVFDKATALWLQKVLGTASVTKIDSGIDEALPKERPNGPMKKHSSSTAKVAAFRFNQMVKSVIDEDKMSLCNESLNGNYVHDRRYICETHGTIWPALDSTESFRTIEGYSHRGLIGILRTSWERVIRKKSSTMLISPAVFWRPKGSDKIRGKENVLYCNGIWLDVDGGELTPDAFASFFPHLWFVAFNSFSHTKEVRRWRIYIPTLTAMSANEYELIAESIVRSIEQKGMLDHGIDKKRQACNLFYFPCQAADRSASFFSEFNEGRSALEPDEWLDAAKLAFNEELDRPLIKTVKRDGAVEMQVDAALARWGSVGVQPHHGDREFFMLGVTLAKIGLDLQEVTAILHIAASRAHTPADRYRQIPGIIHSCRRYGLSALGDALEEVRC